MLTGALAMIVVAAIALGVWLLAKYGPAAGQAWHEDPAEQYESSRSVPLAAHSGVILAVAAMLAVERKETPTLRGKTAAVLVRRGFGAGGARLSRDPPQ
jgi:ferric-dicitrate binding protein FerR (iron transport regulator)